jgi:integrase
LIFAFALASGMRPEEYLSLKWSDIDFDKNTATVQRTLIWRKGGAVGISANRKPQNHGEPCRCPKAFLLN